MRELMIGVADTQKDTCFAYYNTVKIPEKHKVRDIARMLARACLDHQSFVFASFPKGTSWDIADKKMEKLWAKHHK